MTLMPKDSTSYTASDSTTATTPARLTSRR
jgi:hypothetical protein